MEIHNITWRNIEIEITFTRDKFEMIDHIELRTEPRTPLPVTETGYRSNHLPLGNIDYAGGAIPFVVAWLDHEAERTGWDGAQLSLF